MERYFVEVRVDIVEDDIVIDSFNLNDWCGSESEVESIIEEWKVEFDDEVEVLRVYRVELLENLTQEFERR